MRMRIIEIVKKNGALIAVLAAIIIFVLLSELTGLGCPFRVMLGITCAGCGMTRAYKALLRLDIAAAFNYHPLFWIVPVYFVFYLLRDKYPRLFVVVTYISMALMLVVWVIRLVDPSDSVVYFNVKSGLLYNWWRDIVDLVAK